jgi:hypothetical protein
MCVYMYRHLNVVYIYVRIYLYMCVCVYLCVYLFMYVFMYVFVYSNNKNNTEIINWSFILITILEVGNFTSCWTLCFDWVYLSYMSVVLMQVSWCHILPPVHLIQTARVPLLSQSFLLHTKKPILSFVFVRLLDLWEVLLGALFLWRNNYSLANLFPVRLHHIYPLCALWQRMHERNGDNISNRSSAWC